MGRSEWHQNFTLAPFLSQQLLHDLAVDIGQSIIAALEAVGELFVIETKEVHPGGLKVVDVDFVASH